MILILLGPPGSGKGTSSNLICKNHNLFPLSTGDVLRERMKQSDDFGKHITQLMRTGELLPDELINNLVKEIIESDKIKSDYKGILFDGYPRTVKQAQFLEKLLADNNRKVNYVLLFKIANNTIVDRVASRRIDRKTGNVYNLIFNPPPENADLDLYQREDDKEDIILHRLEIYKKQTEPLIDFYKKYGITREIDASKVIDEMLDSVDKILSEMK
jgi:adenylate kinase